jgi:hypothetical protein
MEGLIMQRLSPGVRRLLLGLAVLACLLSVHHGTASGRAPAPAGAPALPGAAVKAQDPRVWAGVSASVPDATTNAMFALKEVNRLVIGVALVNDGDVPIPFDRAATRLIINGEAVAAFDRNGPVWTEVKSGRPFGASTGGVGRYFSRPGLYKVQWAGEGFSSSVLEIRVTGD